MTVESIIFDLFTHDAGVALGREGVFTVRGRERENYTWLI